MAKREAGGRLPGALIILAAAGLVITVLYSQHLYPNYSLSNNYISDLGVGSTAPIFNGGIIVYGLLLILSSFYLFRSPHRYRALGFFFGGIGGICVGVFPETTGILHVMSACLAFGSVSVMALGFARVFKRPILYYSVASGLIGLAIMALFVLGLLGLRVNLGLGKGSIEEILFYNEALWALVVGVSMLLRKI